jgi:competence protein ComEC
MVGPSFQMSFAAVAAARTAPADILVDRQGQIAAVRGADGRLEIVGRSASRFIVDRWLAADGDLRKAQNPDLRRNTACDREGCVGALADGRFLAIVIAPEAFEEDCKRAAVIVTSLTAPAYCRESALVLDRERLAVSSSLAMRLEGKAFRITETRPSAQWKPWYGRAEMAGEAAADAVSPPASQSQPRMPQESVTQEQRTDPHDDGADILTP